MGMYIAIQADINSVDVVISRPQVHSDPIIVKATRNIGIHVTRKIETLLFSL